MSQGRILLVDGDPLEAQCFCDVLRKSDYEVVTLPDGDEVLDTLSTEDWTVAVLDLKVRDGEALLEEAVTLAPPRPVVVLLETVGEAAAALERGAWGYLLRPLDPDLARLVISRAYRWVRAQTELEHSVREQEELRKQVHRLRALNRVSHAIGHAFELNTILEHSTAVLLDVIEREVAVVLLLNPTTSHLYVATARGVPKERVRFHQPFPLHDSIAGRVVIEGRMDVGHRVPAEPYLDPEICAEVKNYVLVPLCVTEGITWDSDRERGTKLAVVGALGIFSHRDEPCTPEDLALLSTIGNQLGVAVTRAQYAADLRQANVQLEAANAELRHLDIMRGQFIQNVAHELRTPLALVRGYIELLAQGVLDEEQRKHAITVARERIVALTKLVEAITTLQDLKAEPLEKAPLAPQHLLQTACRRVQQRARAQGITLTCTSCEDLPMIQGDFVRLTEALHQLLDNACKFSDPGSMVYAWAEASPDRQSVVFYVRDEGIGIPEEEQNRIFERFYQVDGSAARRYGGTGLGLALAKEIVEAHAGQITVKSRVGEGSTFAIMLPAFSGEGRS